MAKFDDTRSYYRATAHEWTPHAPLTGDVRADVAVLGGGYTGLSTALELAQAGYDVALVEAETVGFGASGRNGGQVCTGPGQSIETLRKRVGEDFAQTIWDLSMGAPKLIGERVEKFGIDCNLKCGYLHAA